jgi:tetratricopeptide (TPR) repeat protein
MLSRRTFVVGITVALVLQPSTARAQLRAFAQSVRVLADAAGQAEPSRTNAIRNAADRMEAALVAWDRNVKALETRVDREIAGAPDARAFQLHVELGVAYRTRGRISEALREFDAALALRPSSSDVHVLRALTLEGVRRPDAAARAFAAAWALDRSNPVKAYYVVTRLDAGSEPDRQQARARLADRYQRDAFAAPRPATPPFVALDAIPDSLSRTPVVADATTAEVFALLTAGRFTDAVAALRRPARTSAPGDAADAAVVHFQRGQLDEVRGDVAAARRNYQQALSGALLGRSVLHVAIARLALVEGDGAAAVQSLTEAVRLNSNDPYLHKELAVAHASQGRVDDAFCELVAALLIDPGDAHAHATIGQLFLDAERHGDAVRAFTRTLELKPDAFEARYGLGTALARLGNAGEAARQLELFERERREAQERRRRDIADGVEQQEALRLGPAGQGGAR